MMFLRFYELCNIFFISVNQQHPDFFLLPGPPTIGFVFNSKFFVVFYDIFN
jgi:hypothetical protein